MAQVLDLCTLVGQLSQATIGISNSNNTPEQRLDELKHIYEWVDQTKIDLQVQRMSRMNVQNEYNRLKDMPEREEILTAIDVGIQEQMQDLNIELDLGRQLLTRIMGLVESNMMILLHYMDLIKNRQSELLLDVDSLVEKLRVYEQSPREEIKNPQKDRYVEDVVNSNVLEIQKNAALNLVSQLKQEKQYLNTRLDEASQLLDRANRRIDELQSKFVLNSENNQNENRVIDDLKLTTNQLILKEKNYIEKIKAIEKELENARIEINNFENLKVEYLNKQNKITGNIQLLSLELTKEKSKTSDLEEAIIKMRQNVNQTPNEKAQALAEQLVANTKKMEQMMNRVAFYQNKMIDLELEKEGLTIQLNTFKAKEKSNIEQRMIKSKNSKLSESVRFIDTKPESLNKLTNSVRHKNSIEQIEQKEVYMTSPVEKFTKRSLKQRIFGEELKKSKRGSDVSNSKNNSRNNSIQH